MYTEKNDMQIAGDRVTEADDVQRLDIFYITVYP